MSESFPNEDVMTTSVVTSAVAAVSPSSVAADILSLSHTGGFNGGTRSHQSSTVDLKQRLNEDCTVLSFGDEYISESDFIHLCSVLHNSNELSNQSIQTLQLFGNDLNERCIESLTEAIEKTSALWTVTKLELQWNMLGQCSSIILSNFFRTLTETMIDLRYIDLRNNKLTDSNASSALGLLYEKLAFLDTMDLRWNRLSEQTGIKLMQSMRLRCESQSGGSATIGTVCSPVKCLLSGNQLPSVMFAALENGKGTGVLNDIMDDSKKDPNASLSSSMKSGMGSPSSRSAVALSSSNTDKVTLISENAEMQAEIYDLKQTLGNQCDQIKQLNAHNHALSKTIEHNQKEKEKIEQHLGNEIGIWKERYEDIEEKWLSEREEWFKEREKLVNDNKQYTSQITAKLNKDNQDLTSKIKVLTQEKNVLNNEITVLNANIVQLKLEYEQKCDSSMIFDISNKMNHNHVHGEEDDDDHGIDDGSGSVMKSRVQDRNNIMIISKSDNTQSLSEKINEMNDILNEMKINRNKNDEKWFQIKNEQTMILQDEIKENLMKEIESIQEQLKQEREKHFMIIRENNQHKMDHDKMINNMIEKDEMIKSLNLTINEMNHQIKQLNHDHNLHLKRVLNQHNQQISLIESSLRSYQCKVNELEDSKFILENQLTQMKFNHKKYNHSLMMVSKQLSDLSKEYSMITTDNTTMSPTKKSTTLIDGSNDNDNNDDGSNGGVGLKKKEKKSRESPSRSANRARRISSDLTKENNPKKKKLIKKNDSKKEEQKRKQQRKTDRLLLVSQDGCEEEAEEDEEEAEADEDSPLSSPSSSLVPRSMKKTRDDSNEGMMTSKVNKSKLETIKRRKNKKSSSLDAMSNGKHNRNSHNKSIIHPQTEPRWVSSSSSSSGVSYSGSRSSQLLIDREM